MARSLIPIVVLALSCDQGVKPKPAAEPTPPAPKPAPRVQPPVSADLAEYTKDLGAGSKLISRIETTQGTLTCELY